MIELITLENYKMGRDKLYPKEWTPEVEKNAIKLLLAINSFLNEIGITKAVVSSGFRPSAINAALPNSAKKSAHMTGLACDIQDNKNQDLATLIASKPDLLRKYNLFMENPKSTKNWVHLDICFRIDRPSRIFNP